MARPQKQTVDYFPHDSKASDGTTLTIIDSQFGNDGYAFWFKLLERLAASPGHFLDCRNSARWQFLLAKTHTSEDIACRLLNLLAELDAIDAELWLNKVVWSQNLVDNIADVYKNRRALIPQKPSVNGNNPITFGVSTGGNSTLAGVSTGESTQTKLKETKLKETILGIYNYWNEQGIIIHKKVTSEIEGAIKATLNEYPEEDIVRGIANYAEIQKDDQYYFKYAWTLKDFLKRGLSKFLDIEIARKNYQKDKGNGTHKQNAGKPATQYTDPEELRHELEFEE